MRDEHYAPFRGSPPSDPRRLEAVTVFVLARLRGDQAVYLINGGLYRSQWFAAEAQARADLATCQDALAASGWTPVPFHP